MSVIKEYRTVSEVVGPLMIVDGAVGMVEMALERLSEGEIVELDEERKAAMETFTFRGAGYIH